MEVGSLIPIALFLIGAIALVLVGVPVAFAFCLAGFGLCIIYDIDISALVGSSAQLLCSYAFMSLPLFILVGTLINRSGLARRLVDFIDAITGRVKGGAGVVLVLSNTVFGAISGVAVSALATIGIIMIPEMERLGYPRGYSTGLAVSSSVLSLLIPPSISMIIFGVAGQLPISLLFAATLIPGIILAVTLSIINIIMCHRIPSLQVPSKISFAEQGKNIARTGKKAFFALLLPLVILGGIYSGVFTPTEAAAIAVVYSLFVGWFVYRLLNPRTIWQAVIEAGTLTGSIVIVVFFFFILSRVLVVNEVPSLLLNLFLEISTNKIILLLMFNVALLITGMLMDDASALILAAIVYLPVAEAIGVDPLHFGAICGVNLGMGLITPPVAPLLYMGGIVSGGLPLREYFRPAMYCLILGFLPVLLLTTFIPALSLTLPRLVTAMWR